MVKFAGRLLATGASGTIYTQTALKRVSIKLPRLATRRGKDRR